MNWNSHIVTCLAIPALASSAMAETKLPNIIMMHDDLAKQHPDKLQQMEQKWHTMATGINRLSGKNAASVSGKNPPLLEKSGVPEKKKR